MNAARGPLQPALPQKAPAANVTGGAKLTGRAGVAAHSPSCRAKQEPRTLCSKSCCLAGEIVAVLAARGKSEFCAPARASSTATLMCHRPLLFTLPYGTYMYRIPHHKRMMFPLSNSLEAQRPSCPARERLCLLPALQHLGGPRRLWRNCKFHSLPSPPTRARPDTGAPFELHTSTHRSNVALSLLASRVGRCEGRRTLCRSALARASPFYAREEWSKRAVSEFSRQNAMSQGCRVRRGAAGRRCECGGREGRGTSQKKRTRLEASLAKECRGCGCCAGVVCCSLRLSELNLALWP